MSLNSEPVLFKRNYEMLKKHVILNVWRTILKWQESFDVLIYFSISIQFKVDVLDWTHYRHWFREKTMRTGRMNSTFRRRTAHVLHSSFNQNIRRRLYPMLYNESFRLQRRHYFLASKTDARWHIVSTPHGNTPTWDPSGKNRVTAISQPMLHSLDHFYK